MEVDLIKFSCGIYLTASLQKTILYLFYGSTEDI